MKYIQLILPLLKSLGGVLKNLFLGFFLMKTGAEKQQLKDLKKAEKSRNEVKKITNYLDAKSDADLRKLLTDTKEKHRNDNDT